MNPVDVLKKVPGCKIGAGVGSGEPDINGSMYASCEINGVSFRDDGQGYTTDVPVTVRAVDPDSAAAQTYSGR